MDNKIKIFQTPYELAEAFAEELIGLINDAAKKKRPFTVALSGGSTPELLFTILGDHYSNSADWKFAHFFWGDERCVPPDNIESNFGMTNKTFFLKAAIPELNIHRIFGENAPEDEAIRYSEEISAFTRKRDGLPLFDMIILGLGEDGHTASIFPGHHGLLVSDKICEVAIHPLTSRKRITITGKVINNAGSVTFLVTGKRKAEIVEKILSNASSSYLFPASYIVPVEGELKWYLDVEAGSLLQK